MAGRGSQPDLPGTTKNGGLSNGGRAASTTSIPQPSPTGNNTSSIIKSLGKLKMETTASNGHHNAGRSNNSMTSSSNSLHGGHGPVHRRHDVEKSATADAHINQLRLEIETRLRITMPEDISAALADGVILCHDSQPCEAQGRAQYTCAIAVRGKCILHHNVLIIIFSVYSATKCIDMLYTVQRSIFKAKYFHVGIFLSLHCHVFLLFAE